VRSMGRVVGGKVIAGGNSRLSCDDGDEEDVEEASD
jgi:hypothetical protein